MPKIVIIAEITGTQIQPFTYELLAAAREIESFLAQAGNRAPISIIIPSANPEAAAAELAASTELNIIGLKTAEFADGGSDVYIDCLGELIKGINPSHILIAHSAQGRDFAPGLTLELEAATISGVNGIHFENGEINFSRAAFENTRNQLLRPQAGRPLLLTLQPGIFKPETDKPTNDRIKNDKLQPDQPVTGRPEKTAAETAKSTKLKSVSIHEIPFDPTVCDKNRIRLKQTCKRSGENQALKKAGIVVAAGRGIKKKENLDLIFKFAKSFANAAVGASRPLVDMGWIGYQHQVGITGATIAPDLYIACGISGSSQHLAGMKKAKFVIAINQNPKAPICRHADICINADVIEFIEYFLKNVKICPA